MASLKFLKPPIIACMELTRTLKNTDGKSISEAWFITQFFCELLKINCFDVDDFASQRQSAISCLPDVIQERFLHSSKFRCSVLLHFLVACSLADFLLRKSLILVYHASNLNRFVALPVLIIFIFASKLNDFIFPI
jgi:hypothetical protein